MLPQLFSRLNEDSEFQTTFSYRNSPKYVEGMRRKITSPVNEFPRSYPNFGDPSEYPEWFPRFLRWTLLRLWALIGVPFLITYETLDLFFLFRRIKPEVLHVNNGGYPGAPSARAAIIAGKLLRVRLKVMVVNNMAQDYRSKYRLLDFPIDRLVVNSTDFFITGSHCAMDRLISVLKLPKNKAIVIPNGIAGPASTTVQSVPSGRSKPKFSGTTFGIIGELVPRKGHSYLIDAIAELRDSKTIDPLTFRLLIVGEGYLRTTLESYVLERDLGQYIFFIGYIENIFELMEKIEVLVLPSTEYEDFPYVILEGMSMMKPIIGSRVAGIPEQLDHGVNGLIVTPGNHLELAQAIEKLYMEPPSRKRLGENARKKFQVNFTSKIATSKYKELYLSVNNQG